MRKQAVLRGALELFWALLETAEMKQNGEIRQGGDKQSKYHDDTLILTDLVAYEVTRARLK